MLYVPFTDAWKTNFSISTPQKKKLLPFHFHYTLFSPSLDYELYTKMKWGLDVQFILLASYCLWIQCVLHSRSKLRKLKNLCVCLNYVSLFICIMLCWIIHSLSQRWKKMRQKIHKNKLNKKKYCIKMIFLYYYF